MVTFLFYDIETSGLSPYFDQVLTFAAIRTDLNLDEIERYSITIRLRPDIVPSPGAFITHRLTLEELSKGGVSEYEATLKIHSIINTPGTISIGYNSLGFDDEFLRFAFYRNMLDPYSHQYAEGCSRMDLLPVVTLFRIFRPEVIKWPVRKDPDTGLESPTLKLELINEVNSLITSGRAHDAMTDVEATVALARCLSREKKMWAYALDFFDKMKDRERMDSIHSLFAPEEHLLNHHGDENKIMDSSLSGRKYIYALYVSHKIGSECMYISPVLGIGRSRHYKNQTLWIRLDRDILPESGALDPDELFVIRKKDGEGGFILPPLERFWKRLSSTQKDSFDRNTKAISSSSSCRQLIDQIVDYHRDFKYPFVPEADIDSALYQAPFFTRGEKADMTKFHKGTLGEKIGFVERLNESRIKTMAERILCRNFSSDELPILISAPCSEYMDKLKRCGEDDKKIIGFRNDVKLTPEAAEKEIFKIRDEADEGKLLLDREQREILKWLEVYISSI